MDRRSSAVVKTTIILSSAELKRRAVAIINGLALDPVHEVVIREHKKNRSLEQNAFYWEILTIIGNALGESKEAVAERYKDKFLVQIYERDDPEYAEMVQSLREVWKQGMKKEAVNLRKRIVSFTSTTSANVSQMAEYLTNIERDAASLGIRLPFYE
jgi:hypothetical protein